MNRKTAVKDRRRYCIGMGERNRFTGVRKNDFVTDLNYGIWNQLVTSHRTFVLLRSTLLSSLPGLLQMTAKFFKNIFVEISAPKLNGLIYHSITSRQPRPYTPLFQVCINSLNDCIWRATRPKRGLDRWWRQRIQLPSGRLQIYFVLEQRARGALIGLDYSCS